MKNFIKFTLVWISQNLAVPFWIVDHIHLSVNVYEDIHEILASGEKESFQINGYRKECLINGYDNIDYLISQKEKIAAFEAAK